MEALPQFTRGIPTLVSEGVVSADMGRLSTPTTLMSSGTRTPSPMPKRQKPITEFLLVTRPWLRYWYESVNQQQKPTSFRKYLATDRVSRPAILVAPWLPDASLS